MVNRKLKTMNVFLDKVVVDAEKLCRNHEVRLVCLEDKFNRYLEVRLVCLEDKFNRYLEEWLSLEEKFNKICHDWKSVVQISN
jgi:hypothetical protein